MVTFITNKCNVVPAHISETMCALYLATAFACSGICCGYFIASVFSTYVQVVISILFWFTRKVFLVADLCAYSVLNSTVRTFAFTYNDSVFPSKLSGLYFQQFLGEGRSVSMTIYYLYFKSNIFSLFNDFMMYRFILLCHDNLLLLFIRTHQFQRHN